MPLPVFSITFAQSHVEIGYDSDAALAYLTLLFGGFSPGDVDLSSSHRFSLLLDTADNYLLYDEKTQLFNGELNVRFAAHLYDIIIFHLLNGAKNGIALHTGAVVRNDKTILLPGLSGAGKSTLTAWLVSRGCSYLTDELVFLGIDDPGSIEYFRRPICLKPGSLHLLDEFLHEPGSSDLLIDEHGAIVPHRLISKAEPASAAAPDIVILPEYRSDAKPMLEPISTARLATLLMGCHVNARNLVDHGFKQILEIARTATAHRLRYCTLDNVEQFIEPILDDDG